MLETAAYLERIGYSGIPRPDLETLCALHRAHLLTVPFENLDIGLGRMISCEESAFVHKIVHLRRGGFCYEMNGAFAALLRSLQFEVTLLSARVPRPDGSLAPEFDHLTLRVDLEEPWLADVGFGDSFLEPLPLKSRSDQTQAGKKFRICEQHDSLLVQRNHGVGVWKAEYTFTLMPRTLDDFAPMCHYHQTSPESPFTRKKLCTRATENGRITLSEMRLIITRGGRRDERALASEEEWRQVLADQFGVSLGA
jgi:N-hydroxyarylamine O-acetyltransferase